jgi:hypothetical protein
LPFAWISLSAPADHLLQVPAISIHASALANYFIWSKGLWRWYIGTNITFLDIIHHFCLKCCPVSLSKETRRWIMSKNIIFVLISY